MTDTDMLTAYVEISQVKARYCRFLDTKDWTAFTNLFTEDLVLDVSDGTNLEPLRGRDGAMQYVQAALGTARTAHQVHSPEIDLRGDEAHVIWAMQDRVEWDPPRGGLASLTGYGHYHERYVRRDGGWKIAASRLTRLMIDFQRV
jgi:SnoaL-like domain